MTDLGVEEAALSAFMRVALVVLKDWILFRRRIRISVSEERGSITREYGFPEKAIAVKITNCSSATVEVQDIRLMFTRRFGVPLAAAPPPLTHPTLPAAIVSESAMTWYFPAEKLASLLQMLDSKVPDGPRVVRIHPRVKTSTRKVRGRRRLRLSLDVDSHWP